MKVKFEKLVYSCWLLSEIYEGIKSVSNKGFLKELEKQFVKHSNKVIKTVMFIIEGRAGLEVKRGRDETGLPWNPFSPVSDTCIDLLKYLRVYATSPDETIKGKAREAVLGLVGLFSKFVFETADGDGLLPDPDKVWDELDEITHRFHLPAVPGV
jgi:hypothetical protein